MKISKGTVFGEVEYTQNEDGSWSFRLTLDDDPVPIESDWPFPSKELAEEHVNYALDSASFANRRGLNARAFPFAGSTLDQAAMSLQMM